MVLPKGVSNQLKRLNALARGPSAVRVDPNVVAVNLQFHRFVGEPAVGAKHFWRRMLPPVQFHNPQLAISVTRTAEPIPPRFTVTYKDGTSHDTGIENLDDAAILDRFIAATKAEPVPENEQPLLHENTDQFARQ